MSRTLARPTPIPAPHRTAINHAHHAERLRSQLADFWGKPVRGLPHGADLMAAMHLTATGRDLVHDPDAIGLYFTMCANFADAYRTSEVWVAPHSMAERIAQHPLVNNDSVIVGYLEDAAPARDGLIYFPTPVHFDDLYPIHAIAWHMEGTGNDLALSVETITATRHVPARLPPLLAASTKLPRASYCPNGVTTLYEGVLSGYSNPHLFGAPDRATALALVLAFWELRSPTTADDDTPGEDTLTVPQHTSTGTKNTGRSRKDKRNNKSPRKRRIRIIREPAHASHARPTTATEVTSGPKWKEDTLRWEVTEKWQNRCPNPHQHRAIVEAGGECKPVRVRVKEHTNGPKGRAIDPRRTVRIVPDRT
ncbi:hypothetical protein [Streptomyces sp. NPDC002553]|uniref:hypothetical protein n=1 Tax=Streptomyces sp. NPDC002553 TaxID=3154417 RepID=UPI00332EE7A0